MAEVDGAQILAKALKNAEVEKIFTLTGGHIFRIYQECEKVGIEVIDTRHESAAGYAAMAYAHTTGKPGIVVATAGPGITNMVTPVADCKLGEVPLIVLGGSAKVSEHLYEQLQEYETVNLMKTNTLWAERCVETRRIAEYVAAAHRHCIGAVPGPVYLELPIDVLQISKVEEEEVIYPAGYLAAARVLGEPALIEEAADLLVSAERPALIVGDSAQFGLKNPEAIRELIEYLQIPASCGYTNKGFFFRENSPLCQAGGLASGQADVILTLNYRYDATKGALNPRARLISVHRNAYHIGLNRRVDVGIVGSADAVAGQILEIVKSKAGKRRSSSWVDSLTDMRENLKRKLAPVLTSGNVPVHPARLAAEVQKFLNTEGQQYNVVLDGGDCMTWELLTAGLLMEDTGSHIGRMYFGSRFGAIGYGAGSVTGCWSATGRPILYVTGDGSLGQYLGEFFTYVKMHIPVICIISNDSNFGMIRAMANAFTPNENNALGCILEDSGGCGMFNYEKVAAAWGGYGELVTDPNEIIPAIRRAQVSGNPAIINVAVWNDQSAYSPATFKLYAGLMERPYSPKY
ncbi:MAG TPA: thiamine pyrophosphate-binding protein [Desulfitobacteriaceae bacterium]|nr:thiamine pyrophosphate-binding protein [Desulfitobacteriaceae bacterium]